jgi:hypothetical protein
MTDDCKQRFIELRKKAADDVKQIKKERAEFNKQKEKGITGAWANLRKSRNIDINRRLKDAIKFRDVTLLIYEKIECK